MTGSVAVGRTRTESEWAWFGHLSLRAATPRKICIRSVFSTVSTSSPVQPASWQAANPHQSCSTQLLEEHIAYTPGPLLLMAIQAIELVCWRASEASEEKTRKRYVRFHYSRLACGLILLQEGDIIGPLLL